MRGTSGCEGGPHQPSTWSLTVTADQTSTGGCAAAGVSCLVCSLQLSLLSVLRLFAVPICVCLRCSMYLGAASLLTSSTVRMTTCRTMQQQPSTQHCRYTSTNQKVRTQISPRFQMHLQPVAVAVVLPFQHIKNCSKLGHQLSVFILANASRAGVSLLVCLQVTYWSSSQDKQRLTRQSQNSTQLYVHYQKAVLEISWCCRYTLRSHLSCSCVCSGHLSPVCGAASLPPMLLRRLSLLRVLCMSLTVG